MTGSGGGPGSGPGYHRLTVKAVHDETAEARSFVLVPERGETALFRYRPGQFLSFRIPHDDGEILRSYSLSSAPCCDPDMTVCVKRVAEGRGSNWVNDRLIAGMRIEATRPAGRFVLRDSDAPLFLVAGGSGITPCLSLIKQALFETGRAVTLLYANQTEAAVIYRQPLELLQRRFAGRFSCRHWYDGTGGFLTAGDITAAADGLEGAESYVCGPDPLMELAEDSLREAFGADATILTERFVSPDDPPAVPSKVATAEPASATLERFRLTLDGQDHAVPIEAGDTLLEAALAAGIDAPFSCTEGHCGSCMGRLRSGEVTMESTQALSKRNIERGYVLACQAKPASAAEIWLDFDL